MSINDCYKIADPRAISKLSDEWLELKEHFRGMTTTETGQLLEMALQEQYRDQAVDVMRNIEYDLRELNSTLNKIADILRGDTSCK